MKKRNSSITLALLMIALFCPFARADKVLLKNGNTLEGSIVKEDSAAIWLEFRSADGRGQTKISKSAIQSVEVSPAPEKPAPSYATAASSVKSTAGIFSKATGKDFNAKKKAAGIMAGIFFVLLTLPSLVLGRIIKVELKKPFWIKCLCLWINYCMVIFFLLGAICTSLALNGIFFQFKGMKLIVFLSVTLGIPAALCAIFIGLYYMRAWVRGFFTFVLILCALGTGAEAMLKKNFAGDFFQNIGQKLLQEYPLQSLRLPPEIPAAKVFHAYKSITQPYDKWALLGFFLMLIFYLNRRKTQEAFEIANQQKLSQSINKARLAISVLFIFVLGFVMNRFYQYAFIQLTDNPRLFSYPLQSKGLIKKEPGLFGGFKTYQALGYTVHLPQGMETVKTPKMNMVSFLKRDRGRLFSLRKITPEEFRMYNAFAYARWNPVLLVMKSAISPMFGRLMGSREIKLEAYEGIMASYSNDGLNSRNFVFYLKDKKGNALECMAGGQPDDPFIEEGNVVHMIALIE